MGEAEQWAQELANSEGEAFEQAMTRIKPESDELEQAYRQGYTQGLMKRRYDNSIYEIAFHYGYEAQREQFVEELAEAILAVQKLKRHGSKENFEALESEVADVLIMAQQMRLLMSTSSIDRIIESKLNRQIERMKGEVI